MNGHNQIFNDWYLSFTSNDSVEPNEWFARVDLALFSIVLPSIILVKLFQPCHYSQ